MTELFRKKLSKEGNVKKLEHTCDCCGMHFTMYRRDLTAAIVSFMVALNNMIKDTGVEYHEFRRVINYAKINFNLTPSDYSLLESRWGLIKSKEGNNNDKFKTLTISGRKFLDNELAVSIFHYKVPVSGTLLFSKDKKRFTDIISEEFSKKDKKSPFNYS